MSRRNRAAFGKAKADGATTWLGEEFHRGDNGVIRTATRRVPVVPDDGGDWKQKFIADDGALYYDRDAVRKFDAHFDARPHAASGDKRKASWF